MSKAALEQPFRVSKTALETTPNRTRTPPSSAAFDTRTRWRFSLTHSRSHNSHFPRAIFTSLLILLLPWYGAMHISRPPGGVDEQTTASAESDFGIEHSPIEHYRPKPWTTILRAATEAGAPNFLSYTRRVLYTKRMWMLRTKRHQSRAQQH